MWIDGEGSVPKLPAKRLARTTGDCAVRGATLRIVRNLGGVRQVMTVFRIVPRSVRDRLYDWMASNRYRWFGRREDCMIPTAELRQRFLE